MTVRGSCGGFGHTLGSFDKGSGGGFVKRSTAEDPGAFGKRMQGFDLGAFGGNAECLGADPKMGGGFRKI